MWWISLFRLNYLWILSHSFSGTGVSDYGDVLIAPTVGQVNFNNGSDGKPGYSSRFSHTNESAHAGYYQVS